MHMYHKTRSLVSKAETHKQTNNQNMHKISYKSASYATCGNGRAYKKPHSNILKNTGGTALCLRSNATTQR
jgi:hypothetical protein